MKRNKRKRTWERVIDGLICAAVIAFSLFLLRFIALRAFGTEASEQMAGWYETHPKLAPLVEFDDESLRWLSVLVYKESRYCTDEQQQLVAMVAVNRRRRPDFGDTWEEIITEPGYPSYYRSDRAYENIRDTDEYQRCMTNALMALHGLVDCPEDLVFQAQFIQGKAVWKAITVDTGWYRSTTYFCLG